MEEKDQALNPKPGLPEAINPEIGNGALWEKDPHLRNLRSVDPLSVMDSQLMNEDSRLAIIRKWKEPNEQPIPVLPELTKELPEIRHETQESADLKEPDLPPVPIEGKRVRKAVKKAEKQRKRLEKAEKTYVQESLESRLSPFTSWLKSLRGSEYVHPYEDDYGLEQRPVSQGDGISETFADLLATQGYKDQAIDMYKLLMTKYPEKSSFFAAKIEGLQ